MISTNTLMKTALASFCCGAALVAFSWGYQQGTTTLELVAKDPNACLYVPGAGFSGFFYTIGHLQAASTLKEPTVSTRIVEPWKDNTDYYCFSAGCLATVAALSNITVFDVHDTAFAIQDLWKSGEISQFQVVEEFVDYLIAKGSEEGTLNAESLAKIHVITSKVSPSKDSWLAAPKLDTIVRTPQNLEELKETLLQTTWIPGATGDDWTLDGHLDGAFTSSNHPMCQSSVDLPKLSLTSWDSLEFYANILLGVNMGQEQIERFWSAGVKRGLQVTDVDTGAQP
ncbi:expressed unknown protein [Seminavis robusta]|uniref:Uncharacterized protein n=1 Tax=Seminavis robusta TaxID=568900 RepID=A0A9N8HEG3_9STRA|nr:expressed unknown protein [Seminavis robusta]|eukprot:Sro405_g136160.1 n/a (284) ;mRNA; f:38021-38872